MLDSKHDETGAAGADQLTVFDLSAAPGGRAARVCAGQADAMDASVVRIESSFARGFAGMQLLGNASDVARDGKERARVALESLGINLPPRRIVVSATPADVKKDGNQFDLPVAVSLAVLVTGKEPRLAAEEWLFAAELGLTGELRPVRGVVSYVLAAAAAGLSGVVVAAASLAEVEVLFDLAALAATPAGRIDVVAFDHLGGVLAWLFAGDESGVKRAGTRRPTALPAVAAPASTAPNFDDMLLSPRLTRAALAAAAGPHSLLLRGPPGTGKSMLSARFPSILPPLGTDEHLEAMRIHGIASERLPPPLLAGRPPYRAPHHQASAAAILGSPETPGEMALAHGGVLFLDELPEFRRDLLEALREPLETGEVRVARAKRRVCWKARVVLVAACNNCPCGWFGSRRRLCTCAQNKLMAYRHRLSGPILERIDLHVNVPEPEGEAADLFAELAAAPAAGRTQRLAAQVAAARARARQRNERFGVAFNRDLAARDLVAASGLSAAEFERLVNRSVPRTASSRSALRTLRVARTLADLDGSASLRPDDLAQAYAFQAEAAARERGETIPLSG